MLGSCIGRGNADGCGAMGESGDTCGVCGGMILSTKARRRAAALAEAWAKWDTGRQALEHRLMEEE